MRPRDRFEQLKLTAAEHRFDAMAVCGLVALLAGINKIHKPSAWIVGGVLVMVFAVLKDWAGGSRSGGPNS